MNLVIENANIWTGDNRIISNGWLMIKDGRIHGFGPHQYTMKIDPKFQRVNLNGLWVLPSFCDSHVHLFGYAISLDRLDFDGLKFEEIKIKIKDKLKDSCKGQWIFGRGWELNKWGLNRYPDKSDLDTISKIHPMAFTSKDGHSIWLNSMAMELIGLDAISQEFPSDMVVKDNDQCTGLFFEMAADKLGNALPSISDDELGKKLNNAVKHLYSLGITAVHSFESFDRFKTIMHMKPKLRIVHYFKPDDLEKVEKNNLQIQDINNSDSGYVLAGLKLFADGALGSRTARMMDAYNDDPKNFGIEYSTMKDLEHWIEESYRLGYPVAVHAIGNRAVNNVLNAFEKNAKYKRHNGIDRIEHAQIVLKADFQRFKNLNLAASVQPLHLLADIEMAEKYWNNQRGLLYPYKTFLDHHVLILINSDAPIENPNILRSIEAAITRKRTNGFPGENGWIPEQKIDMDSALKAVTINPSKVAGISNHYGKIYVGLYADLVVLDHSPYTLLDHKMSRVEIIATILGGDAVFDKYDYFQIS